jgi:hypothetical protein
MGLPSRPRSRRPGRTAPACGTPRRTPDRGRQRAPAAAWAWWERPAEGSPPGLGRRSPAPSLAPCAAAPFSSRFLLVAAREAELSSSPQISRLILQELWKSSTSAITGSLSVITRVRRSRTRPQSRRGRSYAPSRTTATTSTATWCQPALRQRRLQERKHRCRPYRVTTGNRTRRRRSLARWSHLGRKRLRDVTQPPIDAYCAHIRVDGAGVPTVNRTLGLLQGVCHRAVEWHRASPAKRCRRRSRSGSASPSSSSPSPASSSSSTSRAVDQRRTCSSSPTRRAVQVGQVPTALVRPMIEEAFERYGRTGTAMMMNLRQERLLHGVARERRGVRFDVAERTLAWACVPE